MKYIPRIFIAFLAWVIVYALYKCDFNIIDSLKMIKDGLPSKHLWFLIMIGGLYVVTPIIRVFLKSATKKDIQYFLLLSFIIVSLVPFLLDMKPFKWIDEYYGYFYPAIVTGFSGLYIAGYYIDKYGLSKKEKIAIYVLGIISIIVTISLNLYEARSSGESTERFLNKLYPNTVLYGVFMFVFLKDICSKIKFSDKVSKFTVSISKSVFGIYLMHVLVKWILDINGISLLMFNSYISIPIVAMLIFIISLVLSKILSKIPIVRKAIL